MVKTPTDLYSLEALATRITRMDGWQNVLTGLGNPTRDASLSTKHVIRDPLDRTTIENIYREDALAARIIDAVPKHGTRRWIEISGTGGSKVKDFGKTALDAMEDLDIRQKCYDFWRMDRLCGGAIMFLGVDDGRSGPGALAEPVDEANVKSLDFVTVLPHYEVSVTVDYERLSPTYNEPLFYSVNGVDIHSSRCLRLTGVQIYPRSALGFAIPGGFGFSVLERCYEALRRFGSIYGYMEALFKDLSSLTLSIEGLSTLVAGDDGNNLLMKRLSLMAMTQSLFNATLLDDGETAERRTATFTGIRDGVVACMDELAAVAEMPLSILFGQPPAGLSTDDSGGRTAFYDTIENEQYRVLKKPINRILSLLFASKRVKAVPKDWFFRFLPLESPNEAEISTRRFTEAQTREIDVNTGIVSPEEARSQLQNDPHGQYVLGPNAPAAPPASAKTPVVNKGRPT